MLGRSVGLTYEKLRHLPDDPLPEGVYSPAEAAVVRYAQRSTKGLAIDASTFRALAEHFSTPQIIDICLNVGLSHERRGIRGVGRAPARLSPEAHGLKLGVRRTLKWLKV